MKPLQLAAMAVSAALVADSADAFTTQTITAMGTVQGGGTITSGTTLATVTTASSSAYAVTLPQCTSTLALAGYSILVVNGPSYVSSYSPLVPIYLFPYLHDNINSNLPDYSIIVPGPGQILLTCANYNSGAPPNGQWVSSINFFTAVAPVQISPSLTSGASAASVISLNIYPAGNATTPGDTSSLMLGLGALSAQTTASGGNNTGLGASAGAALTTGVNNTFVGSSAGSALMSGFANIIIGYNAGSSTLTTGSHNILIGAGASGYCDTALSSTSYDFRICAANSATALLEGSLITSSLSLTVNGPLTFVHAIGGGTTLTSSNIVAGAGAGSTHGGSASVSSNATDLSGTIIVATGTATTTGIIATLSFAKAYATYGPNCVFSPNNIPTGALSGIWAGTTTGTLVLTSSATALAVNTTYQWTYLCAQ